MGRALTALLVAVLVGGVPMLATASALDPVEVDVETGVGEVHVDTTGGAGGLSIQPAAGNATEANDTVEANVSSGDDHVAVRSGDGGAEVDASLSPTEMQVRVGDGQLVELTYTPPTVDEVVHEVPTTTDAAHEAEPEPASERVAAPSEDDDSDLAWTVAPVAGIAAAAAAGHALPVGRWMRRVLGLAPAVPMFSRIQPDEVLDHEAREAIYALLDEQAGLSLEALCQRLDMARSTARHHVRKLEQANVIEHTRLGRARVHHLVGQRHRAVREHLLTNDTREAVYGAVEDEALTITEIARRLDANPGSVHFHLGKLEGAGLVERVGEDARRYRARLLDEDVLQSL